MKVDVRTLTPGSVDFYLLVILQARVATAATAVVSVFPPVFASTPRKMHCWKLVESGYERVQSSIAIRKSGCTRLWQKKKETDTDFPLRASRCPCLTCTVKIAQVGISEVVYSQGYNMDKDVCFFRLLLLGHTDTGV